ncbi:MAG TPA: CDP-alcohol phosphatidyltransferase family protein [Jatrophihabitans sp.]|uniref:CDP-alcohol phosphatidyltransferase family protein n=1 Tax=Jatrophihabitans sp. TaxID=1932789 RepID=UPI002DF95791|nr:CDP-alcohol phosphatidyltransferase family protein [Jatrophihabitans sp.]
MTTPAQRWSARHHGIDPGDVPLLSGWLALMWRLARPLAAWRVPPTAITALGVLLAVDAVLLAGSWPWAAALAVLASVLCDALDGAVAVVSDRTTGHGAAADAIADRIADAAFAAVIWRCGAPWPLAAGAAALAWAVDLLRRVRRVPARITVAERPSWTACTVLAGASATVTEARWPVLVCAAVWIVLGLIGVAQVLVED